MVAVAAGLGIEGSALFVLSARDRAVELSARNIPHLHVTTVDGLNVYDILRHERLILVRDALPLVQSRLEP
jgi:large subunit ribosomal protein L4